MPKSLAQAARVPPNLPHPGHTGPAPTSPWVAWPASAHHSSACAESSLFPFAGHAAVCCSLANPSMFPVSGSQSYTPSRFSDVLVDVMNWPNMAPFYNKLIWAWHIRHRWFLSLRVNWTPWWSHQAYIFQMEEVISRMWEFLLEWEIVCVCFQSTPHPVSQTVCGEVKVIATCGINPWAYS